MVYCNLLWKWGKRSDSQCDKCLKCSHQHEWTADLMECLSVMYATVTAKTKADIYHLWGSWDLQGPACPPIRLEFLGIPKALNEPGKLSSFCGRGSGRIKMKWMKNSPDKLLNRSKKLLLFFFKFTFFFFFFFSRPLRVQWQQWCRPLESFHWSTLQVQPLMLSFKQRGGGSSFIVFAMMRTPPTPTTLVITHI